MDRLSKKDYDFEVLYLDDLEDKNSLFSEKLDVIIGISFFVNFLILTLIYSKLFRSSHPSSHLSSKNLARSQQAESV